MDTENLKFRKNIFGLEEVLPKKLKVRRKKSRNKNRAVNCEGPWFSFYKINYSARTAVKFSPL